MGQLTPIQESFSAGEISPLMGQRSQTEGYQQGVAEMVNMFADSRGPAFSRAGSHYVAEDVGNDGRIIAINTSDEFFYSGIFLHEKLTLTGLVGHNPNDSHGADPHFLNGGAGWSDGTDGHVSSTVTYPLHNAHLHVSDSAGRFAVVGQQVTVPAIGNYRIIWSHAGHESATLKLGTSLDDGSVETHAINSHDGEIVVNFTSTVLWISFRLDGDAAEERDVFLDFFAVDDEVSTPTIFATPYQEQELAALQGVQSPSGNDIYILHEHHAPRKITYDPVSDSFTFTLVSFVAPPAEWSGSNWPQTGDFFQGRLWLGGSPLQPQTFWASKSGLPENFTQGSLADDGMAFTMAKYGRIVWMVGFKNLVIGTRNGEHIVTSDGGVIKPGDIQVQQQSSYGSANVQPIQVGDQVFYVSADRRKLRAIQYEWQKDNWLSKDLTFNSEHITRAGIRHISWQQNPKNLFQCVLNDGTLASLTYERGHNVYGWSRLEWQKGKVLDVATGIISGIDLGNALIQNKPGVINFESQTISEERHYLDSWVDVFPEVDGVTIIGLDHLEDFKVQVLINGAVHPDRTVSGGSITLQSQTDLDAHITVGLKFVPRIKTLPFDQGAPAGSGAGWQKRWNKVYIRVLSSTLPLINGERAPDRSPSTPMNTPESPSTAEILKVNLGQSRHAEVTIEQDLPHNLVVLGVFGELSQSKL